MITFLLSTNSAGIGGISKICRILFRSVVFSRYIRATATSLCLLNLLWIGQGQGQDRIGY
jgi:hypothetical protein